jgi:phosphocarrier protein FPr
MVNEGDDVKTGDPLISFDADYIAENAESLLTMIVITNGDINVKPLSGGLAKAGKTPLLEVGAPGSEEESSASRGTVKSMPIVILNPNGLHARPASVLVNCAKQFSSAIRISKDGREANAKSVVSIMGMEIKAHDSVIVTATGEDAASAIASLVPLIQAGLGENLHAIPGKPQDIPPSPAPRKSRDPDILIGTPASPGLVTGEIFQLRDAAIDIDKNGGDAEEEKSSFNDAVITSKEELSEIERSLRLRADTGKAAIFAAHRELLDDPELLEATMQGIGRGESAAYAWRSAYTEQADALEKLSNELLAARACDIRDIGLRVLRRLAGDEAKGMEIGRDAVLIAKDLTPSDTANLEGSGVRGFCITSGSATSHASILARAAGIPAIVAADESALDLPNGTFVILDGEKGELRLNPTDEEIKAVRATQQEAERVAREELLGAVNPAVTSDGARIKVVGNISGASEAREIPSLGGEGVGLLRSEFLFLQRTEAPSEEEQSSVYIAIAKALGPGRDLIVRTLDVGGDKPLAYLPLPQEVNPFLGVRGIRLNMLGTELFSSQVRAILSAAPYARLGVMFPMVATIEELRAAKKIVLYEKAAMGITSDVQIGIMIEVPSAALMSDLLAHEVDFFSIGTNDLTQYVLAMDRGHPRLAHIADALHPAVLRLISFTVNSAHKAGKWVGVCGGLAGEAAAAPILLGLGVDELSVSIKAIPAIKAAVRRENMDRCRLMAREALEMTTADEVRSYLAANSKKSSEAGKEETA